jgi:hypothetical protein
VASAGGRYFGFVTGGALPATLAAQYLAAAWDQNSFSYTSSPAIAGFETAALRWVKQALGLPMSAEGALVTGATLANFTCLAAARHRVLAAQGWDVERQGPFGAPPITVIVGEEAHATLYKVLAMLGLGRDRVLCVPADDHGDRRRPEQAVSVGVPALLRQDAVPRRRQAGEVRQGGTGDQRALRPRVKTQGLLHPGERRGFEAGYGGRRGEAEAVLVPGGGKDLRGKRRRQGAAGHEAEVAAAGTGDGGGRDHVVEKSQHLGRLRRRVGQVCRQRRGETLNGFGRCGNRAAVQAAEVGGSASSRVGQQGVEGDVLHGAL